MATLGSAPAIVKLGTGRHIWVGLLARNPASGDPVPPKRFSLDIHVQVTDGGALFGKVLLTSPEIYVLVRGADARVIGYGIAQMEKAWTSGHQYKAAIRLNFPEGFRPTRDRIALELYRAEWPGLLGRDVSVPELLAEAVTGSASTLWLMSVPPFLLPDDPKGADDWYGDPDERGNLLNRLTADLKSGLGFVLVAGLAYMLAGGRKPSITIVNPPRD